MLNGVSHDLRTILTGFKLSLALMRETEETRDLQKDVEEMQRMLEAYLAFARGDAGESAANIDMEEFLEDLRLDAERAGFDAKVSFSGNPLVTVRPDAFKRCLANLIGNAQSHANRISIEAVRDRRFLTITSTTTLWHSARRARTCSGCFSASMACNQTTGLALRSPSTSPACMAATSARRQQGRGLGRRCGCRCSLAHFAASSKTRKR